jgi:hypothetical protein
MMPVIVFLLLISLGSELSAQSCQSGFTPKTVSMTINGCNYDVFFCVKCQTGPFPGEVIFMGFVQSLPACTQTLTPQQVLDAILNQMNIPAFIWSICPESQQNVGPCPSQAATFSHHIPVCWKMERRMYLGVHDRIYYSFCDEENMVTCDETYYICFNNVPPPGHFERHTLLGPSLSGTPNCSLESWEVEIPTELYTPTECYRFNTECDD